jgi:hypothetical protein
MCFCKHGDDLLCRGRCTGPRGSDLKGGNNGQGKRRCASLRSLGQGGNDEPARARARHVSLRSLGQRGNDEPARARHVSLRGSGQKRGNDNRSSAVVPDLLWIFQSSEHHAHFTHSLHCYYIFVNLLAPPTLHQPNPHTDV